jgi:hypothetical protein
VICCELARISAHMLGVGVFAMDVGAMTVFLYTFTEREKIYNLCEQLTGARFTTSYTRVGGQIRDLPTGFEAAVNFLNELEPVIDEIDKLLSRNKIFIDRTQDIGVISREDAIAYGITRAESARIGVDSTCARRIPTSTTRSMSSTSRWARRAIATTVTSSAWRRCARACASCARFSKPARRTDQRGRREGPAPEEGEGPHEDGGADPPFHHRHAGHRRACW